MSSLTKKLLLLGLIGLLIVYLSSFYPSYQTLIIIFCFVFLPAIFFSQYMIMSIRQFIYYYKSPKEITKTEDGLELTYLDFWSKKYTKTIKFSEINYMLYLYTGAFENRDPRAERSDYTLVLGDNLSNQKIYIAKNPLSNYDIFDIKETVIEKVGLEESLNWFFRKLWTKKLMDQLNRYRIINKEKMAILIDLIISVFLVITIGYILFTPNKISETISLLLK